MRQETAKFVTHSQKFCKRALWAIRISYEPPGIRTGFLIFATSAADLGVLTEGHPISLLQAAAATCGG